MRSAPDENVPLFSGRNYDLTVYERIHFKLYRCQQFDIGLRNMERGDEAVARFRVIAVQSAWYFPPALPPGQAVWRWQVKSKACGGDMSVMFAFGFCRPLCAKSGSK